MTDLGAFLIGMGIYWGLAAVGDAIKDAVRLWLSTEKNVVVNLNQKREAP